MTAEFNLIQQHFTRATHHTDLGIGDDAALTQLAQGMQLVVSTDMSVAGTHFFADAAPDDIGWKTLAVNISDMAAMGAQAKWATLALAMPEVNNNWLAEFSRGFFACADMFGVDLIGGDTTRGPLNISVTIMGEVPLGQALRRDGAKLGDDIWVSGQLGNAALGLAHLQSKIKLEKDAVQANIHALCRPMPRAALGLALRGIATSCIDISDGLLADLGHILQASNLGSALHLEKLPVSLYHAKQLDDPMVQQCVLAGGDDYELCFTAPASQRAQIEAISTQQNIPITCIASTSVSRMNVGLQAMYKNVYLDLKIQGFNHFG